MFPRVRVLLVVSLLLVLVLACAGDRDVSKESREVIVYTTLRLPNQDIYLVDRPNAAPRRKTEHLGLDYNATFSPDGRWLVFTSERDRNVDLYALDLDADSDPVRLTHHPAMDDAADFSPDGRQIAFVSTRDGNADVFVMPFAPDDTTFEAHANIYAMDADGGNVHRITDEPGVETTPDVSPDGTWLTLATDRGGAGMKVWIQRLDGSQGRFLEPDRRGVAGIDIHPRFSPDSAWIVLTSDRGGWSDEPLLSDDPQPFGDLWAVPIEDGAPVRLTDNKWEDGLAQWGIH